MFRSQRPVAMFVAIVTMLGLALAFVIPGTAGAAGTTRTSGTGESVDLSWVEYDPEDLLGLPGNVHIGYLSAQSGPYGSYVSGNVTDFNCAEGQSPFGGHQGVAVIVDEAAETVDTAQVDAIDAAIDAGESTIDADVVLDVVQGDLSEEIPAVIIDEVEKVGFCDFVQNRFLNGDGTTEFSVDAKGLVARITGTLTVSNGGHGEPGTVLGNPPVNITITGGEWNSYDYSYKSEGANYKYSDSSKGTSYYGGEVTGGIGPMGFADDADDESWGGFGSFKFKTSENFR